MRNNTIDTWGENLICNPNLYPSQNGELTLLKPHFPANSSKINRACKILTEVNTTDDLMNLNAEEIAQVAAYFVNDNLWTELQLLESLNFKNQTSHFLDYNVLYFDQAERNIGTLLDIKAKNISSHKDIDTLLFLLVKGARGSAEDKLIENLTARAEESSRPDFQFRCLYTANLMRVIQGEIDPLELCKRMVVESSSQKLNPFSPVEMEETSLIKSYVDMLRESEKKDPHTFLKILDSFGIKQEEQWEVHLNMLGVQNKFGAPISNLAGYSYSTLSDLTKHKSRVEFADVWTPFKQELKEAFKLLQMKPEEKEQISQRLSFSPELEQGLVLRTFYDFKILQREIGKYSDNGSVNGRTLNAIENNRKEADFFIHPACVNDFSKKSREILGIKEDQRVFTYHQNLFKKDDYLIVGNKFLAEDYWNKKQLEKQENAQQEILKAELEQELNKKGFFKRLFGFGK